MKAGCSGAGGWKGNSHLLSSVCASTVAFCAYCAKSLQSCSTLCNPMNHGLPDTSVHGDSPGKNTRVGCHALLLAAAAAAAAAKSLQSCPTLCDPIDGSPSGSAFPGILQARILEWVAISFFNASK